MLTRANNQVAVEEELGLIGNLNNIHFLYYDLPSWTRWWKKGSRGIYLYYLLWQWGAYKDVAIQFHKIEQFDIVHHITFGVFRTPKLYVEIGDSVCVRTSSRRRESTF